MLSVAAFMLQWQSRVVAMDNLWLTKPQILSLWPFKKFSDLCCSLVLHFSFSVPLAFGYQLSYYLFAFIFIFVSPLEALEGRPFLFYSLMPSSRHKMDAENVCAE